MVLIIKGAKYSSSIKNGKLYFNLKESDSYTTVECEGNLEVIIQRSDNWDLSKKTKEIELDISKYSKVVFCSI